MNQDTAITTSADRRRVAPQQKRYQLDELYAMHHEIIRLLAIGQKPEEIAELLHITTQTVSNVRNTTLARAKMQVLQQCRDREFAVATKRVTDLMPKALNLLEVLLKQGESIAGYDPSTALKIVDKTLGFAQFTQPKTNGVNLHLHQHGSGGVTAEDLAAVKKSTAAAVEEGAVECIVDAEYVEADASQVAPTELTDEVKELLLQDGFFQ